MIRHIYTLCFSLWGLFLLSCARETNEPSPQSIFSRRANFDKPELEVFDNPLDEWIYEEFTKPYNIEVKWRTDIREHRPSTFVTPPRPEKVKELFTAIKRLWLEPYGEEAGQGFIKQHAPKLFFLAGSHEFNSDGTVTEGVAEGGRKITLTAVDHFNIKNPESMRRSFHTMHHEFGHILNQRKPFSDAYILLSKGLYRADWHNVRDYDAKKLGFITNYSMLNEHEDFVEIVGTMLSVVGNSNVPVSRQVPRLDSQDRLIEGETVNLLFTDFEYLVHMSGLGRERLENDSLGDYVQEEGAAEGKRILRKKIDMVRAYYKTVWGIDLDALQKRIERAMQALQSEYNKPQDGTNN